MYKCTIIGLADEAKSLSLHPEVVELIHAGRVFSGGIRHHKLVAGLLPQDAVWIDITVPIADVIERYSRYDDIIIFASGDPLFYGFGATVRRLLPDCKMRVIPSFHSLQMLAHRLNMPYADMRAVSLTGRSWKTLDDALISGERLIGCLTDRSKTPQAIYERMMEYGYDNYRIYVGEHLGNGELERVTVFQPGMEVGMPNCVIAEQTQPRHRRFGLLEAAFSHLNGRSKMITKMPIRITSLAALELDRRRVFWDVGFCTGSVSIEARLLYPHLRITAFERREGGRELMLQNSHRFGAPGIDTIIADFLDVELTTLERPDAVFIGGHGGHLQEMITRLHDILNPDGCIVFNSVSPDSRAVFEDSVKAVNMRCTSCSTITLDDNNPITILRAEYDTL